MLKKAMLQEPLSNSRVKCHICPWRCEIAPEKTGVCRMRINKEGTLYLLNYALVSSVNADPIEKKPLFHFYPGTLVFSLGSWGCNFHCLHCQNWEISQTEPRQGDREGYEISPEMAIHLTQRYGCRGIAWTYNEPIIWFEYTYDGAQLAKQKGLYTVYVTNGFITPEALDTIGPYLDAFRVDIKGFSDKFYVGLAKITRWREILAMTIRAKEKWGMHIEVVTNVIPTMNDDEEQLLSLACWIRDKLGELVPWHITRFYPHHKLLHLPPTPISTLEKAWQIGKKAGLRFVYIGNVPGHPAENTTCYSCGKLLIERFGYQTRIRALKDSSCPFCGAEINVRR